MNQFLQDNLMKNLLLMCLLTTLSVGAKESPVVFSDGLKTSMGLEEVKHLRTGEKLGFILGSEFVEYKVQPSTNNPSILLLQSLDQARTLGILSVSDNKVQGTVQSLNGDVYQLRTYNKSVHVSKSNYHLTNDVDNVVFPTQGNTEKQTNNFKSSSINPDILSDKDFNNTIDLLFIYDPELQSFADTNNISIVETVRNSVSLASELFAQSDTNGSLRLRGVVTHSLKDIGNSPLGVSLTTAVDLMKLDPALSRLKREYSADAIFYIAANDPNAAGRATVATNISHSASNLNQVTSLMHNFAVGAFVLEHLGARTLAHELGHTLGLKHDRITLAGSSAGSGQQFDYHEPYGYIPESGAFYTIMAYGASCRAINTSCSEELLFSNPAVSINQENAGIDSNSTNSANAVASLRKSIPLLANSGSYYKPEALFMSNDGQGITLEWGLVDGATQYTVLNQSCEALSTGLDYRDFRDDNTFEGNQINLVDNGFSPTGEFCVVARNSDSVVFLGGAESYSNDIFMPNMSNPVKHEIYLQKSNLILTKAGDVAITAIHLLDESILNDDIIVTNKLGDNGEVEPNWTDTSSSEFAAQAILLNEFFDISVSGTGTERSLQITLLKDIDLLEESLTDSDLRTFSPWLIRIGYEVTDFAGFKHKPKTTLSISPEATNDEQVLTYTHTNTAELKAGQILATVENAKDGDFITFIQTSGPSVDVEWEQDLTTIGGLTSIDIDGRFVAPAVDNSEVISFSLFLGDKALSSELTHTIEPLDTSVLSISGSTDELDEGVIDAVIIDVADSDEAVITQTAGPTATVSWTPRFTNQDGIVSIELSGSFTAPAVEEDSILEFSVSIRGETIPGIISHTVRRKDISPIVTITSPNIFNAGSNIVLTSSVIDDNSDLSYSWTKDSGPNIQMDNQNTASLTLINPPQGNYTFTLVVTDNEGLTGTTQTIITINPEETSSGGGGGSFSVGLLFLTLLLTRRK